MSISRVSINVADIGNRHLRDGITLLEVLISLGILSIGLASVVAIIPAGGEQAKKAIVDDRRGALGPNALADCVNRGLLDKTKWTPAQPLAATYKLVFDPVSAGALAPGGLTPVTVSGFAAGLLADEIFRGQDDLVYKTPEDEDAPALPQFFPDQAKRLTEGTFSWLATLVPLTTSPTSPAHRLTVITIHRRGDAITGTASVASGLYVTFTPTAAIQPEDVADFFSPGSPVLLTNGSDVYEWRKVVMASPTTFAAGAVSVIELTLDRTASATINRLHAIAGANGVYEKAVRLEEMSPWSQ
jgi:hypothetical protein